MTSTDVRISLFWFYTLKERPPVLFFFLLSNVYMTYMFSLSFLPLEKTKEASQFCPTCLTGTIVCSILYIIILRNECEVQFQKNAAKV